jgi:hypothetical protein
VTDNSGYANVRIYAQLRPDPAGLEHLVRLQQALPPHRGRLVPQRQLHVTLIHFGKVHDVHGVIERHSGVPYDEYAALLSRYIADTEAELPTGSSVLVPVELAGFGRNGRTLAVQYRPTAELIDVHQRLLGILRTFLRDCGLPDPDEFMAQDTNFMFARTFNPHITVCKGFGGNPPRLPLEPLRVEPMQVVYRPG